MIPTVNLTVISFYEAPWEPKYVNKIWSKVNEIGGKCFLWSDIKDKDETFWQNLFIDIIFVVSWRFIIPPTIYNNAKIGSYLLHDSLLPEYRGFSPSVWSIINGKNYTGATLLEIGQKVDTGDILDQIKIPIHIDDQISDVMELVTEAYLDLLQNNIENIINGKIVKITQDHLKATNNRKRNLSDNLIDWHSSAIQIYNMIRALTKPYPGAYTFLNQRKLIIWKASLIKDINIEIVKAPGSLIKIIINKGVVVHTYEGSILIEKVQYENDEQKVASVVLNSLDIILG